MGMTDTNPGQLACVQIQTVSQRSKVIALYDQGRIAWIFVYQVHGHTQFLDHENSRLVKA
jgi:hypothetical protein